MKIYLDSADVRSWSLPTGCPSVQGVTTNPTLVYQAGLEVALPTYLRLLGAVADHGLAELMLQLPRADVADARRWSDALRAEARRLNVALTLKLPCHPDWAPCIDLMGSLGQDFLLTGLSSPVQLLWAHERKARWVAPYVGRLVNDGRNVAALMEACVRVQGLGGPGLLAASIKSPDVLAQLIGWGAEAVTLPPSSLVAWSRDALTEAAMAQFERDIQASHKRAE